jgi:uncharacterized protein (TIGR02391 family)
MKINDALHELWVNGFFEKQIPTNLVKSELDNKYGMHPTNVTVHLKGCRKFLRKDSGGWIQRTRYSNTLMPLNNSVQRLSLYNVTADKRLIKACESNYLAKNYSDTVFNAMRHLEVRVREKSGLSAVEVGADLMEKAFKPSVGILTIPSCATVSEQDGFKQILKGIMMFHRNPKGHREETIEEEAALKIIGYVDYLLQVVAAGQKT